MNRDIQAIVKQYPTLTLQLNKGERHRIMRSGIRRGSLWISPRINAYCITPTGEVASLMDHFLRSGFGPETGKDRSYNYWNISDVADVSSIVRHFGER